MALTAKIICLASLLILFPTGEKNVAATAGPQSKGVHLESGKRSFDRSAVEARPEPVPSRLKVFSQPLFLSQFAIPNLYVDHFRQTYPDYYHQQFGFVPHPYFNSIPQYDPGMGYVNFLPSFVKDSCTGEYKAHESDCGSYYRCIHGQWVQQNCADGLHWNNGFCDWPASANCQGSGSPPPVEPIVAEAEKPISPPIEPVLVEEIPPHVSEQPTTASTTVSPPTTTHQPDVTVPDTGYKVICYFTNWAIYRPGVGQYKAEDIDASLCTHILYGFATLNGHENVIQVFDGWADGTDPYGHNLYQKVTAFKSKGIKVLIALGGWNDSLGSKYSNMVNNAASRKKFVDSAVAFIEKWGFDGLDLDWEYPKCWQTDCNAGPASDKQAFTAWVKELSAAFKPRGWLLSSAVSPSKTVIDNGYEVAELSKYFDWIGVMTYDYFGNWDKNTGHVAPLYASPMIDNVFFNTNFTLNYWIQQGADPKKIIMGIPTYGQSFTLVDPNKHGYGDAASGPGQQGEFTRQGGFLSFYEICTKLNKESWTVVQDPDGDMGPYAYSGNQWTSYDDVQIIRKKSEVVKKMGLGGAMIWALDLDDFKNVCGCEPHPLLRTINRVLRNYPGNDPDCKYGKSRLA